MMLQPVDTPENRITTSERCLKRNGMLRQSTALLIDTSFQRAMPGSKLQ
jgi:hypothetical protein